MSGMVAAVVCFLYADLYFLTTPQDYAFLAVVAVAVAALLRDAYLSITQSRADSASRSGAAAAAPGADAGAAALWGSAFQTTFWYFVCFGLLQYVLVPQVLDKSAINPAIPSSARWVAWTDAAISALLPAAGAFAVGRGKL